MVMMRTITLEKVNVRTLQVFLAMKIFSNTVTTCISAKQNQERLNGTNFCLFTRRFFKKIWENNSKLNMKTFQKIFGTNLVNKIH